jgi:hypothetical protein
MEFAWVALNYLGIERSTTEPVVRSVDIVGSSSLSQKRKGY